jgi:hypothetical protein
MNLQMIRRRVIQRRTEEKCGMMNAIDEKRLSFIHRLLFLIHHLLFLYVLGAPLW